MKRTEYFGINISNLKSGDVITSAELTNLYEKNVHVKPDGSRAQPYFAFILNLKKDIEQTLLDNGKYARCVQRRNDLHLIQGSALSEYNAIKAERAMGQFIKESATMDLVDTSSMNNDELSRHNRAKVVLSTQVEGVKAVRIKLQLQSGTASAVEQLQSVKIDFE